MILLLRVLINGRMVIRINGIILELPMIEVTVIVSEFIKEANNGIQNPVTVQILMLFSA